MMQANLDKIFNRVTTSSSGTAGVYGAGVGMRFGPGRKTASAPGYVLTASTPSPFNLATNPACRNRFATSLGTSRPLVSLFGVPV